MLWIAAIFWLFLFTARPIVAPPPNLYTALAPDYPLQPACYDNNPPIVQSNPGNVTCSAKCLIGASSVQILFWPTETVGPNADNAPKTESSLPSGMVSNGMTFVSPSVYIAYHDLKAYVSCPEGYYTCGKVYNTTIAYAPVDVSASVSARAHQTCAFSAIDYTSLANFSFRNTTDFILSLPSALFSIDPAWSTCAPATYGAFDPPVTLTRATALTDPGSESHSSTRAAPGISIGPPYSPAITTSTAASSTLGVSSVVPKLNIPRTSDPPSSSAAHPTESAALKSSRDAAVSEIHSQTASDISHGESKEPKRDGRTDTLPISGLQASHNTAVSVSPLHTYSEMSRSESKKQDPHDPTNTLPLPDHQNPHDTATSKKVTLIPSRTSRGGSNVPSNEDPATALSDPVRSELTVGDHTTNKDDAPVKTPIATATSKDGLDPLSSTQRLINSIIAPADRPMSSDDTVLPANIFNPTVDGSTRVILHSPFTLPNGLLLNPSRNSSRTSLESNITLTPDLPAATRSDPVLRSISSVLNSTIPSPTTAPMPNNALTSASNNAITPATAQGSTTRFSTTQTHAAGTNTPTIKILHTSGESRSRHGFLMICLIWIGLAFGIAVRAL